VNDKPREVSGTPVKVTLYEDRAEVVRRAKARLEAGPQWVAVGGVTPFVDDRSVQAKVVAKGVRVLAARVRRRVTQVTDAGREEIEKLGVEERQARARVESAGRGAERAEAQRSRLTDLFVEWRRSLAQVPQGARAAAIAGWKGAYASLGEQLQAAAQGSLAAGFEQKDASEALARAKARHQKALTTRPRCESFVEVQLEAQAPAEVDLEVTYRTPCALWRPEHLVRLVTDGDEARQGKLEIVTWATAWQRTGEAWDNVQATFSTARPARAAVPPLLGSDVLSTRKKTEEEKRTVQVEVRDQIIATAGAASGKRAVQEMPGVDDGGLPLSFTPTSPVSLPSDGSPFRVEINHLTLDAAVARILFPERAGVAHWRATATHADRVPLLAGPMRVARGAALVGRAKMDFVAPGEPFEVGFGPDDALRVRRAMEVKRDTTILTGTQKIERTVKLYLSNLSDQERKVQLKERIPVSEIEGVEIELKEAKGFSHEAKDGFLQAEIAVAPRETRALSLKYEIRAKSNVQLPF